MGLDIHAYSKVVYVGPITDDYDGPCKSLRAEPQFAASCDGLIDGLYQVSGEGRHFRAGSYSGYNLWRAQLAALIGSSDKVIWLDPQPGPFVELINNSDCNGFIGPKTSAKLAADFAQWDDAARDFSARHGDEHWFYSLYTEWRRAFELAANGGVVRFA